MADQLYLSVWFPNFRFADLPARTVAVLRQFARIGGLPRVAAAAAYPVSFAEPPVYSRVYVLDKRAMEGPGADDSLIENAVAECMELLHEDTAYEFEMKWQLWTYEAPVAGLDAAWAFDEESELWEDDDARADAAKYIKENVEMLLAFTLSVEKHCGVSSRLLWTESGEPLAEKLVARLQKLN